MKAVFRFGRDGLAKCAQSIKQKVVNIVSNQPIQLQEVQKSNIQIPLSILIDCISNLSVDIAVWVNEEIKKLSRRSRM